MQLTSVLRSLAILFSFLAPDLLVLQSSFVSGLKVLRTSRYLKSRRYGRSKLRTQALIMSLILRMMMW
jgi:hypothetical protein